VAVDVLGALEEKTKHGGSVCDVLESHLHAVTILFERDVRLATYTTDCWRCYDCETPHTRGVAMRGELGLHAVLIIQIVYQTLRAIRLIGCLGCDVPALDCMGRM